MKMRTLTLALFSAGLLAACGGGGSSDDKKSTVVTGNVTLTGVVASYEAPLVAAAVTVKCAAGTGSGTTGSDGSYKVDLQNAALPCVLKASGSTLVMHSVAPSDGNTTNTEVVVNISPLTELLVAQLTGADPESFMETVTTTQLTGLVTTTQVRTAQTSVLETLVTAGVTTTGLTDLISGALSFSGTGTRYAITLTDLGSSLSSSGSTLESLSDAVAATAAGTSAAGTSTATAATSTPSLPADLLLKAKAATCDALRSTTYRAVTFGPSTANRRQRPGH
jgi:hypothetical protein